MDAGAGAIQFLTEGISAPLVEKDQSGEMVQRETARDSWLRAIFERGDKNSDNELSFVGLVLLFLRAPSIPFAPL